MERWARSPKLSGSLWVLLLSIGICVQHLHCPVTSPPSHCSSTNWLGKMNVSKHQSSLQLRDSCLYGYIAIVWLHPYPRIQRFQSSQLKRCNAEPKETEIFFNKILHVSLCLVAEFRWDSPWSRWPEAGVVWTPPAFWILCVTSEPPAHQWWREVLGTADRTCSCRCCMPEGEPHATAA